jgi:hypothetical protein
LLTLFSADSFLLLRVRIIVSAREFRGIVMGIFWDWLTGGDTDSGGGGRG